MALIKCPECGKEISDQAKACIHCEYPIPKAKPQTDFTTFVNDSAESNQDYCLTTVKNTAIPTRCFSWMTVYPARVLSEVIFSVCTEW